jgi:hypothetical protein
MKLRPIFVLLAGAVVAGSFTAGNRVQAQVTKDDVAWINRCIADNKDAMVSQDVVRKYCMCMNEEMDDNETRSITAFEKANPAARKKCDAAAGWK